MALASHRPGRLRRPTARTRRRARGDRARGAARLAPPRALLGLGAVAFCVLLAEGALNDWSAVYLSRVHDAAPATAAAGLAVFSLTMGGSRLAGDRLAAAFGSRAVARGGLLLGAAGFAAAAVAPSAPAAIVAFAGLGLGLASVYPFTMRAAAARSDVPAGVAIGAVTTLGYVGFLLGPPLVGLLAHATSLRVALAVVGGLCLPAAWLARAVTDGSPPPTCMGVPTPRAVQRTYLLLTLGNTLAASFIWGINTIFLLDAGLSNLEAFAANAFFTAGMVLFEVPTGIVADTVGRRASYLLGTITLTVTTLLYVWLWEIHAAFWLWALASLGLGLGFTFFSGAVEAWLVDALARDRVHRRARDRVRARADRRRRGDAHRLAGRRRARPGGQPRLPVRPARGGPRGDVRGRVRVDA